MEEFFHTRRKTRRAKAPRRLVEIVKEGEAAPV
jgi:hypothetical protein